MAEELDLAFAVPVISLTWEEMTFSFLPEREEGQSGSWKVESQGKNSTFEQSH